MFEWTTFSIFESDSLKQNKKKVIVDFQNIKITVSKVYLLGGIYYLHGNINFSNSIASCRAIVGRYNPLNNYYGPGTFLFHSVFA